MSKIKCAEQEECVQILKEHGAKIVRTKKHTIWRFPDGKAWTMPSTPGDKCAWKNNLSDLRLFLKLNPERGKPGERRVKKAKTKRQRAEIAILSSSPRGPAHDLKEQLGSLRIVEVKSVSVDGVNIPMEAVTIETPPTVSEWPSAETLFSNSLEAQAEATDGLDAKVERTEANPSADQSYWVRFWRWVFA